MGRSSLPRVANHHIIIDNEPMIVRAASQDDVPMITEIYNEAVLNGTASWDLEPVSVKNRLDWFGAKMTGSWPVLVAENAGDIWGWASLGRFRDKPGYQHTVEHSMYVQRDRRGHGAGSQLLVALVAEARRRGVHAMVGGVSADNTRSIAFHERHGFVVVGRLQEVGRKFDRWLDLVFMQLLLG